MLQEVGYTAMQIKLEIKLKIYTAEGAEIC